MTGAAAWMMTRRWDWPHMALLFAMWSAMMVGMMLPSAVAAIVGYGRTQRGTPARPVAPTCAFVAAYVLVWMLFSLAATLAQRVMYELHLLSPMMEPATTALAGSLLLAAGIYQLLPFKHTCLASCRGLAGLPLQERTVAEAYAAALRGRRDEPRCCRRLDWGGGFNVLVVRDGALFSPPEGILMGITRQTVFELAAEHGIPGREAQLTAYDLYAADEVFATSTARGIMPLVEVDGRPIGDGKPGSVSQRIHGLYWTLRESGRHGTPFVAAGAT